VCYGSQWLLVVVACPRDLVGRSVWSPSAAAPAHLCGTLEAGLLREAEVVARAKVEVVAAADREVGPLRSPRAGRSQWPRATAHGLVFAGLMAGWPLSGRRHR
jgi:hypothetical protein